MREFFLSDSTFLQVSAALRIPIALGEFYQKVHALWKK